MKTTNVVVSIQQSVYDTVILLSGQETYEGLLMKKMLFWERWTTDDEIMLHNLRLLFKGGLTS
jgi:hypothetical protein